MADRGSHEISTYTTNFSAGRYTLSVSHNGPVDIRIDCAGSATGRSAVPAARVVTAPFSPAKGLWFEAESATAVNWQQAASNEASFGAYVVANSGSDSLSAAPSDSDAILTYSFDWDETSSASLWLKTLSPATTSDSFWIKLNEEAWQAWEVGVNTKWTWAALAEFSLTAGTHTVSVAYREDGVQLDQLYVGSGTPIAMGGASDNTNNAPSFIADPINKPIAFEGLEYSDSIADMAVDFDAEQSLTFRKISGAAWLTVASDGKLSGMPSSSDVGVNSFEVEVMDDEGETSATTVNLTVLSSGANGWLRESGRVIAMEAENGEVGERWTVGDDATASNGQYIEVDPQYAASASPDGETSEFVVSYPFIVNSSGNYRFWFRMYSEGSGEDSFFWRMDGGAWTTENNQSGVGAWFSRDTLQTDELAAGYHVLQISYRENGTRLDKFMLQGDSVAAPVDAGVAESNRIIPATSGVWLEAECGSVGALWTQLASVDVSGGSYLIVENDGNNDSTSGAPGTEGQISFSFDLQSGGDYPIWARIYAPSYNDDSFWLQSNAGGWNYHNSLANSAGWYWRQLTSATLNAGSNTLTIGYREDGAGLDKIYIGTETPVELGASASNSCAN